MKKILMTKYGFVRWPEQDFIDDCSRYTCYRAGKNVRVSKLVSNGQVYLSISSEVGKDTLPYEVYSKLPHYYDADQRWNGVPVAGLTDKDLEDFYNACVEYEKEYEKAEASIVYPSLEEIKKQAVLIQALRYQELDNIAKLMALYGLEAAAKLSKYEWARIQDWVSKLFQEAHRYNPDTFPQTIFGNSYSFSFVKPDNFNLRASFYYEEVKKYFDKVRLV